MAMQIYSTPEQRVGIVKGAILAHAVPREVLQKTGQHHEMPKNAGDTVKMRRYLPYSGTSSSPNRFFANGTGDRANVLVQAHMTQEGVTPPPDSIDKQDVTVVLNQYSILYGYTDKTKDLYEDDIPAHMKKLAGERMGLVRELVRFGAVRACTNQFYGGTGTSRGTVNGKITLPLLRKISRALQADHAEPMTAILGTGPDFGSSSVEAAYIIYCHTDCESDFRDLPGFTKVADYANRKPISPYEVGSVENFRIITTPEFVAYQDAGASVGSTGCYSTSSSNIDVYPLVVVGDEAYGDVALRGENSFDVSHIPVGTKSGADPLGQRGYVGALWYDAATVLNNGWMAIVNVGVTAL